MTTETENSILWTLCSNGGNNYTPMYSLSHKRKRLMKAAYDLQNAGIVKVLFHQAKGYHHHDMLCLSRDARKAIESGDYKERYICKDLTIIDA